MNRWQDISISDASLKAEFITKFFDGDYIDAFTIISNNPQLNTKAFVADTINQIATILLSLENNFQNGVIDYLAQQYSNFQNIIDNYNLRGNWSASTTYQIYNFVTYNNIDYLYINLTPSSGNLPTNTDYWVEINIQGEKGAPGLGVNLQYDWSATTPYNALDVVYYNNALWVARVDNINKIPGSTEEWETLSGSIVSFYNDGDIEISNLSVAVEPVQDLHGYDSPWPAGGSINKLDPTVSYGGLTYNPAVGRVLAPTVSTNKWTDNGDGTFGITLGNWAQAGFVIGPLPSGAVYFSFASATGGLRISVFVMDSNYTVNRVSSNRNPITEGEAVAVNTTFSGTDTYLGVYIGGAAQVATISQPYVYTGADASMRTYYPYSNICPISGWNSVEVEAAGINIWDEEWEVGGLNNTGGDWNTNTRIRSKNYIPVKPETTYYNSEPASGLAIDVCCYRDDKSFLALLSPSANTQFTTPPGTFFIRFATYGQYGATYNNDISINYPSTDHAYHPYAGNRYTVALGNTVYGGTLDVTNGTLTVDKVKHSITGAETVNSFSSNRVIVLATSLPFVPKTPGQVISNLFKPVSANATPPIGSVCIYTTNGNIIFGVDTSVITNMSEWTTFATENNLHVVYEIETPFTITLDPVTVSTIPKQTNNVWADAGEVDVELDKKYWEEFIKFKLASIYTDYIEPSADSLYNGLIWFEVFNPQNWSYLTNRNYTWNQINTNNDTWESVDRGDY